MEKIFKSKISETIYNQAEALLEVGGLSRKEFDEFGEDLILNYSEIKKELETAGK